MVQGANFGTQSKPQPRQGAISQNHAASPSELATALALSDYMPGKFEFTARAQRPRPAVAESSSHYQKIGKKKWGPNVAQT
jgi:hypothetical protein